MKPETNTSTMLAVATTPAVKSEVIRSNDELAKLVVFDGERIDKLPDSITSHEVIAYGVSLEETGSLAKSRAMFLLATRESELSEEKSKEFRSDLLNYIDGKAKADAVARTLALTFKDDKAKTKALEAAKSQAASEAKRRFDNIGQSLRAARYMLDNPKAIADGVSVFTVQQALAPLTKTAHPAHAAIVKALKAPGVSQAQVKAVIASNKPTPEAPKDTRSDAQKKSDERTATCAKLAFAVKQSIVHITELHGLDVTQADIITIPVVMSEKATVTLQSRVVELARLFGLDCQPMKAPTVAKPAEVAKPATK